MALQRTDRRLSNRPTLPDGMGIIMSGDAWSGAFQAGALAKLRGRDVGIDTVVGSGFGALNAVIIAGNPRRKWRKRLRAFWRAGPWTEWATTPPRKASGSMTSDALAAELERLVDWKRLNAGKIRCCIIGCDPGGDIITLDNRAGQITLAQVVAAIGLGRDARAVPDGTPQGTSYLDAEAASLAILELPPEIWLEIGLPPVSPSPPTDVSRAAREAWLRRWQQRRRMAVDAGRPGVLVLPIPDEPERRRPSRRAFRPDRLWRLGGRAAEQAMSASRLQAYHRSIGKSRGTERRLSPDFSSFENAYRTVDVLTIPSIGIARADRRVGLLYKAMRQADTSGDMLDYSGERDVAHYGAAVVQIPSKRKIGTIPRPFHIKIWRFEITGKEDPEKHFTVQAMTELSHSEWLDVVGSASAKEALVFVHGFNVAFREALFRMAQIVWDLGYGGLPILYSWASRGGGVRDYGYDRNSALIGRQPFVDLLGDLAAQGITRVHVLAHSMGNFLALDALSAHAQPMPLGIDEFVMAAPDVDLDHFKTIAPQVRKFTKGMTLYASSADKALIASRHLAGNIPRAGDVFQGKPTLIDHIDTIDATMIGDDILGLNHSDYATDKSILSDVKRLFEDGKRPPPKRGVGLDAMPDEASALWWRFAT